MIQTLNRYMPVLFAVMVFVMLYQFVESHWSNRLSTSIVFFIRAEIWFIASFALLGWILVIMTWLYHHSKLPELLKTRTVMDILDRLSNKQAIEQGIIEQEEAVYIDATSLSNALKQHVIGQDQVCDDIAAQIRRRLALAQRGKPVGIFLFAGPPGTGKTYLAKVLAQELEFPLLHFDMTQLASGSYAISQLFGMSKGYAGSDSYGKLTAGLRDTPNTVILLDEIEKAHPDVLKSFLTAWNDGFVTERSDGNQISTTSAIFVLTTNAATDRLRELTETYKNEADALRSAAVNTLNEANFAPEVLNRLDRIFVFGQLKDLDIARVSALEIEDMISSYGLTVASQGIDSEIILALMERYRNTGKHVSTRDLVRAIEEQLADSLIDAKKQGFSIIELSMTSDHQVIAKPKYSTKNSLQKPSVS